jgi:hypothetical protein
LAAFSVEQRRFDNLYRIVVPDDSVLLKKRAVLRGLPREDFRFRRRRWRPRTAYIEYLLDDA